MQVSLGHYKYSLTLEAQSGQYAELIDWLRAHLHESIDVERMAEVAEEAPRSFHRRFLKETGMTPRAFLETLRLQAAKVRLEAGDSVKRAARHTGFGSEAHLAKAFRRRFALTPSLYRAQFGHGVQACIEFRNQLPKTNAGNILRRELRDEAMKKRA